MVARPLEFLSTFLLRARLLAVRECQNLFPTSRERKPHLEQRRGKGGSSKVVLGPSVFLSSGDGYVGELHELQHGCEGRFDVHEGRRDFCQDVAAENSLISPVGENLLIILEWRQVTLELRRGPQGPVLVASGKYSLRAR